MCTAVTAVAVLMVDSHTESGGSRIRTLDLVLCYYVKLKCHPKAYAVKRGVIMHLTESIQHFCLMLFTPAILELEKQVVMSCRPP